METTKTPTAPHPGPLPKGEGETTPVASLSDHVGKRFTPRDPAHYGRGVAFEIIEFIPNYDFGRGKKTPAYIFERVGHGSTTVQPCDSFLANFEPFTG